MSRRHWDRIVPAHRWVALLSLVSPPPIIECIGRLGRGRPPKDSILLFCLCVAHRLHEPATYPSSNSGYNGRHAGLEAEESAALLTREQKPPRKDPVDDPGCRSPPVGTHLPLETPDVGKRLEDGLIEEPVLPDLPVFAWEPPRDLRRHAEEGPLQRRAEGGATATDGIKHRQKSITSAAPPRKTHMLSPAGLL